MKSCKCANFRDNKHAWARNHDQQKRPNRYLKPLTAQKESVYENTYTYPEYLEIGDGQARETSELLSKSPN